MSRNAWLWQFSAAGASGAILLYSRAVLPPLPAGSVLFWAAVCLLLILTLLFRDRRLSMLPAVCAGLLAGAGWGTWQANNLIETRLPASLEGVELEVSGYLCDIPSPGAFGSQRFSLCVTDWQGIPAVVPGERLPSRLRLSVYGEKAKDPIPHRADLTVVLKRPHGSVNPAGFRYESWLFRHGYGATGSVRKIHPAEGTTCSVACRYHRWRAALVMELEALIGSDEHYPVALALLTGHRGALTSTHWDTLKATGTIHLVAISGLHLGLVAVAAALLSRLALVWGLPGRVRPQTIRHAVFCCVVVASTGYALLAGFTVPTRRALLMVLVGGWYLARAARPPFWQGWMLALTMVLLFDPRAPLDRGFWLSFLAVGVLLLLFTGRVGRVRPVSGLVLAQTGIFAGLLPAMVWMGEGSPLAGLITNLIAIPVVSFLVMPVLMLGGVLLVALPAAASWVSVAYDLVLTLLWLPLEYFAAMSLPELIPDAITVLALSALAASLALIPGSGAARMAIGVLAVWGLQEFRSGQPETERPETHFRVHVWDVGQGLSVLVEYGDQTLLYDTGPSVPGSYSAVENVLLPNFRALGIHRIDTLVVSHGDSDHAGGLRQLMEAIPVGRILSGEKHKVAEKLPGRTIGSCGDVPAAVRSPVTLKFWHFPLAAKSNDASCVLMVEAGQMVLLLPGDITRRVEEKLVASGFLSGLDAGSRVLLAPHHGSKTSSGQALLAAFDPDLTLFSAGYRHRYGHPHPDVVSRYRAMALPAENVACSGALRIETQNGELKVARARNNAGFWINPPGPPCRSM